MKQTEARTLFTPSSESSCLRYFAIGNLLFELENGNSSFSSTSLNSLPPSSATSFSQCSSSSSFSGNNSRFCEEDYYQSLSKLKQQFQPVSCISSSNKSNLTEVTFLQERGAFLNQDEQQELLYEFQMKKPAYGPILERYTNLKNQLSGYNQFSQFDQNSDSGMNISSSPNNSQILASSSSLQQQQQQETKENILFQFINQEIAKLNDLNGKQQFFSYTAVQCLEDESTPFIYKTGYSESLIQILGSSRNNFQQMLMRQGTYLPYHQDIRVRSNISLLESFLLCHEKIHQNQNFHTYSENCQLETFERLFFNCVITKYVIPCVYGGTLLGFIVLDIFTIPTSVIKGLLSRRKQSNSQSLPIAFPEEYKQKTEVFLQKIKKYSV